MKKKAAHRRLWVMTVSLPEVVIFFLNACRNSNTWALKPFLFSPQMSLSGFGAACPIKQTRKGFWENGYLICCTKSRQLVEVNDTERRNIFEMPLESTRQTLHSVLFLPLSWKDLMFHLALQYEASPAGGWDWGVGWETECRSGRLENSYKLSAASSPSLFMHLFLLTRPPPPAARNKHIRATQPAMESHSVDFC